MHLNPSDRMPHPVLRLLLLNPLLLLHLLRFLIHSQFYLILIPSILFSLWPPWASRPEWPSQSFCHLSWPCPNPVDSNQHFARCWSEWIDVRSAALPTTNSACLFYLTAATSNTRFLVALFFCSPWLFLMMPKGVIESDSILDRNFCPYTCIYSDKSFWLRVYKLLKFKWRLYEMEVSYYPESCFWMVGCWLLVAYFIWYILSMF